MAAMDARGAAGRARRRGHIAVGSESHGDGWPELRYRNVVPDPDQWEAIRDGLPLPVPPRPTLITDFSSYNTDLTPPGPAAAPVRGPAVVPAPLGGRPHALLPREGGEPAGPAPARADQGRPVEPVRDRSGHRPGRALRTATRRWASPRRRTSVNGGEHTISCWPMWTTGSRSWSTAPCRSARGGSMRLRSRRHAWRPDRRPTWNLRGSASRRADLEVSDLILKRDIYYTLGPGDSGRPRSGQRCAIRAPPHSSTCLPTRTVCRARPTPGCATIPLGPGRYLMLGDNSPWSRDGRAWGRRRPDGPGRARARLGRDRAARAGRCPSR